MSYFHRNIWTLGTFSLGNYSLRDSRRLSQKVDNVVCYDVAIIGGGIIGTAVARGISMKSKNMKLILMEKDDGLGKHQSGHNSGVIHSGVFYRPDSLKARFSRRGVDLILKYCDENKIPYKISGKLIVATDASKLNHLRTLHTRGVANKVEGLEMLWTKEQIRQNEPKCNGIQALWCPKAGNVDFGIVTECFGKDFQRNGGRISLNNEVTIIAESDSADHPILIKTEENDTLKTKFLIICGGLHSDVLSSIIDTDSKKQSVIMSLRVDYQLLKTSSIQTNIYGVPDLRIPFLGIHITPRLDGGLLLGPNAIPALKKEGYRNSDISFAYLKDTISSTSFQNMTRRYFPQCLNQVKKSLWPHFQIEELQSLAEINADNIEKGPAAVQGQLINGDGSFVDDFVFEFFNGSGIEKRVINCKFLPSPAATCSLAIAEYVADKFFQDCEN